MSKSSSVSVGDSWNLQAQHKNFVLDRSLKNKKRVDYSNYASASDEEVSDQMSWIQEKIGWYHTIELRPGITTPGIQNLDNRRQFFFGEGIVKGKTLLDVGSMEGGDSFHAEAAGAHVTAYDVDNYLEYDLGKNEAWDFFVQQYLDAKEKGADEEWLFLNSKRMGFEFCKAVLKSQVNRISGCVYQLDLKQHGQFDIVHCSGLLYHLRNPMLALDRLYGVTGEKLLISTQVFSEEIGHPNALLYFNRTWRETYTNWFMPTPRTFIEMLSSVGFKKIEVVSSNKFVVAAICDK